MGITISETLSKERLKKVTISWSYPKRLDHMWYDERLNNVGLYYISRKFGIKETPLYIGQTYDSYYNRLAAHDFHWLRDYRGKKYIRLGTVTHSSNKGDEEMRALIKDVESTLIYEMRDILIHNTMGRYTYTPKHLYIITNEGYRGEINATVSMREHIDY